MPPAADTRESASVSACAFSVWRIADSAVSPSMPPSQTSPRMPRVASSPEAPTPSRKSWSSPPSGSRTCRFPAASAAARGDRKALAEVSACGFMQRVEAMGQGSRGSRDMLQQGWSCPRRIDPRLSAEATPCQLCPSRSRCGLLGLLGDVRGKSQTRIQVGAFRPGAPILTQPSHLCAVRSGAIKSV